MKNPSLRTSLRKKFLNATSTTPSPTGTPTESEPDAPTPATAGDYASQYSRIAPSATRNINNMADNSKPTNSSLPSIPLPHPPILPAPNEPVQANRESSTRRASPSQRLLDRYKPRARSVPPTIAAASSPPASELASGPESGKGLRGDPQLPPPGQTRVTRVGGVDFDMLAPSSSSAGGKTVSPDGYEYKAEAERDANGKGYGRRSGSSSASSTTPSAAQAQAQGRKERADSYHHLQLQMQLQHQNQQEKEREREKDEEKKFSQPPSQAFSSTPSKTRPPTHHTTGTTGTTCATSLDLARPLTIRKVSRDPPSPPVPLLSHERLALPPRVAGSACGSVRGSGSQVRTEERSETSDRNGRADKNAGKIGLPRPANPLTPTLAMTPVSGAKGDGEEERADQRKACVRGGRVEGRRVEEDEDEEVLVLERTWPCQGGEKINGKPRTTTTATTVTTASPPSVLKRPPPPSPTTLSPSFPYHHGYDPYPQSLNPYPFPTLIFHPPQPPLPSARDPSAHWRAPGFATSRPAQAWGWAKRWTCCRCLGLTIVEQSVCARLACAHERCEGGRFDERESESEGAGLEGEGLQAAVVMGVGVDMGMDMGMGMGEYEPERCVQTPGELEQLRRRARALEKERGEEEERVVIGMGCKVIVPKPPKS